MNITLNQMIEHIMSLQPGFLQKSDFPSTLFIEPDGSQWLSYAKPVHDSHMERLKKYNGKINLEALNQ